MIITKLGHEFTLEFRGVGHVLNLLYCVTRKIGPTFFCCQNFLFTLYSTIKTHNLKIHMPLPLHLNLSLICGKN